MATTDNYISDSEHDSVQSNIDSDLHPTSTKKLCRSSVQHYSKSCSLPAKCTYDSAWEARFTWLEYSKNHQGAFCMICKKWGVALERVGLLNPFRTGSMQLKKWRNTNSLKHIFSHVPQKLLHNRKVYLSINYFRVYPMDKRQKTGWLLRRCWDVLTFLLDVT